MPLNRRPYSGIEPAGPAVVGWLGSLLGFLLTRSSEQRSDLCAQQRFRLQNRVRTLQIFTVASPGLLLHLLSPAVGRGLIAKLTFPPYQSLISHEVICRTVALIFPEHVLVMRRQRPGHHRVVSDSVR